ncbi:MAG: alpha/beta hydrolase [Nannocystaceae bacterium]
MPLFVEIPDPVAGPNRVGQLRIDHRQARRSSSSPPLVLLGGMTQTLSSWGGQLRPLSERREVIVYETRGQGKTNLSLHDVSLAQQVDDFSALLDALNISGPVDLAGFSFGARISLAVAATRHQRVRRLVLSGLGTGRGTLGRVIMRGWKASLDSGNLDTLAWISLADTVGPDYLERHEHELSNIVRATTTRNRFEGIKALFDTSLDESDSTWLPASLAPNIACPTLLISGEFDRIAPPTEVSDLARRIPRAQAHVLPDVGHTVAIESAGAWRSQVVSFLDAEESM